jgi:hypothetical protein
MRTSLICAVASTTLLLVACGSDDGDSGASGSDAAAATTDEVPQSTDAEVDSGNTEPAPAAVDSAGEGSDEGGSNSSGATATLRLANGESYEFSILCALEPQTAAGSEILFTAVSYDDPGLDITQFGDEGAVTDLAVITVYDGDYETLWEAGTVYEAFGGSIELSVDGATIVGTGSFYPAADPAAEPVEGDLQANC